MPRSILIHRWARALCLVAAPVLAAETVDPHMDPTLMPTGCPACHETHGVPGSPMLPQPQKDLCLSCHGAPSDADRQVASGNLSANSEVPFLSSAMALPYTHPLTDGAMRRSEPGAVTCTSCHSPHRSPVQPTTAANTEGRRKLSPRDPTRFEFELCQDCHGNAGIFTQDLTDISRLTNPSNASFHPIESTAGDRSISIVPDLAGHEINCTDCHGNSDRASTQGPHASEHRYILRRRYVTADGAGESEETYALCYGCHDREVLLDESLFPQHSKHVKDLRISCATCHNPHGSVENRALIRFGEETSWGGTSATLKSGRLKFESLGPGVGACYVNCHGIDHDPATYGVDVTFFEAPAPADLLSPAGPLALPGDALGPRLRPDERPRPHQIPP